MKIFSGKSFEDLEQKGDDFFNTGAYGHAKIEYEKALHKLEKKFPKPSEHNGRLEEKIINSKEALAVEHKEKGEELIECGCYSEAEDLFRLALELTEKTELTEDLNNGLQELATRQINLPFREAKDTHSPSEEERETFFSSDTEDV